MKKVVTFFLAIILLESAFSQVSITCTASAMIVSLEQYQGPVLLSREDTIKALDSIISSKIVIPKIEVGMKIEEIKKLFEPPNRTIFLQNDKEILIFPSEDMKETWVYVTQGKVEFIVKKKISTKM